jgi:hypothetical protein
LTVGKLMHVAGAQRRAGKRSRFRLVSGPRSQHCAFAEHPAHDVEGDGGAFCFFACDLGGGASFFGVGRDTRFFGRDERRQTFVQATIDPTFVPGEPAAAGAVVVGETRHR